MSTWDMTARNLGCYSYTLAVTLAAAIAIVGLPGTWPSSDAAYAPMAIALIVGLLLAVRVAPNRRAGTLVLLPAMAVDARFGLAALPLLAYAAIAANLLRGMRGPRVISTSAHMVLAFALAHLIAEVVPTIPGWLTFAVVFASTRVALWLMVKSA